MNRLPPELVKTVMEMSAAGVLDRDIAVHLNKPLAFVQSTRRLYKLGRKKAVGLPAGVLVSSEDADKVLTCRWHITRSGYIAGHPTNKKLVSLHRWLLSAPEHLLVDHINGNPLDNRRENLRLCDHHTNAQNRVSVHCRSKTKVRGVSWDKRKNAYRAVVYAYGKQNHLGYFKSIDEADEVARAFRAIHQPGSSEALAKQKLVVPE